MKIHGTKKTFVIPMNAMSDVAFLLLIFIMLVALINYRKEVKIEYPEAAPENIKRTTAEKNLEIWVNADGGLYLDGTEAELALVESAVEAAYVRAPDTRIHIIADRKTPYEKINRVMSVLQVLQYRVVSLVVKD